MFDSQLSSVDMASGIEKKEKCADIDEKTIESDNKDHIICRPGEIIRDEYKVIKKLGKGSFASVLLVQNIKTDQKVALKVIKNNKDDRQEGMFERMVLKYISYRDPNNTSLCLKMLDSFDYNGHLCIAFEALGIDVFHFLKKNDFYPFPMNQIRHMAYQLCYGVHFLHERGITHTDLKPDNIMFVDSSYTKCYNAEKMRNDRVINRSDIRLIDFGSAISDNDHNRFTISNRCYRAPEVVLKLEWYQQVDVWSIGCILFELYSGDMLFPTEDYNLEHLRMMEARLGPIPQVMAKNIKYFTNGKLNFDPQQENRYQDCCKSLREYIGTEEDDRQFFDLIKKMLEYQPRKRITLREALWHPFFNKLPPNQRLP